MERKAVVRARDTGAETVQALWRVLGRRTAELIRADPDAAAAALEMGLVDVRWLEDPDANRNVTSPPSEVLERFLQRAVDVRPSRLGTLGLGAVQLIASTVGGREPASGTAAIVFCDLEGFTAFTHSQGDAAALEVITAYQRSAGVAVRRNGGRIIKHIGDGLMCTFPDANAAVRAGLALLGTGGGTLRVRAGGHVGEAVTTRDDLIGHTVNLAARVTEEAKGSQFLVTSEMREAAGDVPGVEYAPGRRLRLKGLPDPVTVHEVHLRLP